MTDAKIADRFTGKKVDLLAFCGKTICITDALKESSTKHPGTYYYKIQFLCRDNEGKVGLYFSTSGAKQIVEVLDTLDLDEDLPLYRTLVSFHRSCYFKENMASDKEALDQIIENNNIDLDRL